MLLDPPRTFSDAVACAVDALLAECASFDLDDLSIPELDEAQAVADRVASFSQGWRVRVSAQRAKLVAAGRPKPSPGSKPESSSKPLPAPGRSRAEQARDEAAARAVGWAPSFGKALQAGAISMDHVVTLGRVRSYECVPAHESGMLCRARIHTAEDFAKYLTTWDAERDLEVGVDRVVSQRAKRRVAFFPDRDDPDGLRAMYATLSLTDAEKVENTLRQIANELFRASGDDGTTMPQRLADALVLMTDRAIGGGDGSKSNRHTVVVICDEDSLRSRLEDAALDYTLDGKPVPASELRRLACDANNLPVVMNCAGQILDWGRSHRTATDVQRLALLTMYGGCIIDGCGCPTQLLDIHHLLTWDHGELTNLNAMAPLCKGDHTRSHSEKWTYTRSPDGHITITTRNGQVIPTRRPRKPRRRGERPPIDRPAASAARVATSQAPPGSLFDLAVSG